MHYHVARNGQVYGPYTLEDLRRYVASGHVLPSDSVKSDERPDWISVSALLGDSTFSSAAAQPGMPSTAGPAPYSGPVPPAYSPSGFTPQPFGGYGPNPNLPRPPNLSWGLVLLFDVLTFSLFQLIWNLVLAAWFRRVYPPTRVLLLYAAAAVLIFAQGVMGQTIGFMAGTHRGVAIQHSAGFAGYGLVAITCWVVRLIARFTFRADLERHYNTVEPIGLSINPVLTFFFGGIYLQSVMNRINIIKRAAAFGGYPR